jgi:hypothetical protein
LNSANSLFGLFGCALFSLALFATAFRLQRLPVRVRYAVILVAAVTVLVPVGDLSIVTYVRGVTGDLSITTLVLAGATCVAQLTGRVVIGQRDRRSLCRLLAFAAVFLYPFALGWTPFDPYALGYGSLEFLAVLLLITLAAWWAGLYIVVFIVVVAAFAYLGGAYESRNLWDYLIDPLAALYAIGRLLGHAIRRRSGEVAQAGT